MFLSPPSGIPREAPPQRCRAPRRDDDRPPVDGAGRRSARARESRACCGSASSRRRTSKSTAVTRSRCAPPPPPSTPRALSLDRPSHATLSPLSPRSRRPQGSTSTIDLHAHRMAARASALRDRRGPCCRPAPRGRAARARAALRARVGARASRTRSATSRWRGRVPERDERALARRPTRTRALSRRRVTWTSGMTPPPPPPPPPALLLRYALLDAKELELGAPGGRAAAAAAAMPQEPVGAPLDGRSRSTTRWKASPALRGRERPRPRRRGAPTTASSGSTGRARPVLRPRLAQLEPGPLRARVGPARALAERGRPAQRQLRLGLNPQPRRARRAGRQAADGLGAAHAPLDARPLGGRGARARRRRARDRRGARRERLPDPLRTTGAAARACSRREAVAQARTRTVRRRRAHRPEPRLPRPPRPPPPPPAAPPRACTLVVSQYDKKADVDFSLAVLCTRSRAPRARRPRTARCCAGRGTRAARAARRARRSTRAQPVQTVVDTACRAHPELQAPKELAVGLTLVGPGAAAARGSTACSSTAGLVGRVPPRLHVRRDGRARRGRVPLVPSTFEPPRGAFVPRARRRRCVPRARSGSPPGPTRPPPRRGAVAAAPVWPPPRPYTGTGFSYGEASAGRRPAAGARRRTTPARARARSRRATRRVSARRQDAAAAATRHARCVFVCCVFLEGGRGEWGGWRVEEASGRSGEGSRHGEGGRSAPSPPLTTRRGPRWARRGAGCPRTPGS